MTPVVPSAPSTVSDRWPRCHARLLSYARSPRARLLAPAQDDRRGFFVVRMLTWRSWYAPEPRPAGRECLCRCAGQRGPTARQPTGRRAIAAADPRPRACSPTRRAPCWRIILALLVLLPSLAHRAVLAKTQRSRWPPQQPPGRRPHWRHGPPGGHGRASVSGALLSASYTRSGPRSLGCCAVSAAGRPRAYQPCHHLLPRRRRPPVRRPGISGRSRPRPCSAWSDHPRAARPARVLAPAQRLLLSLRGWRRPPHARPGAWIGGHAYVPAARMTVTALGRPLPALPLVRPAPRAVRVPQEAGRLAELGLLPAALLAGATVSGCAARRPRASSWSPPTLLEAGWSGDLPAGSCQRHVPGRRDAHRACPRSMRPLRPAVRGRSWSTSRSASPAGSRRRGHESHRRPRCSPSPTVTHAPSASSPGHPRPTIAGINRHAFYSGLVGFSHGSPATPPRGGRHTASTPGDERRLGSRLAAAPPAARPAGARLDPGSSPISAGPGSGSPPRRQRPGIRAPAVDPRPPRSCVDRRTGRVEFIHPAASCTSYRPLWRHVRSPSRASLGRNVHAGRSVRAARRRRTARD